jgi:hypothetical protein
MSTTGATDSLTRIENTIKSGTTTLTNLLNLAPGPTAIAGFIAEGVFKAIRLGIAIRQAQRAASAALEQKIRAQSILRQPVVVDLSELSFRSFYRNPINRLVFPAFEQHFSKELDEFDQTGGNPSARAVQILQAAKELVPIFANDPELRRHSDLAAIFEISLIPEVRNTRSVVLEYVTLFPERDLTYREHYERLKDFWKDKLEIENANIDRLQLEAQQELDNAVKELVNKAIFDETGGFVASSLGLAKKLKRISVEEEIAELTELKKTALNKDEIQKRIDELTKLKERLA